MGSHPISGHWENSPFPKGSLRKDDPFFPLEAEMGLPGGPCQVAGLRPGALVCLSSLRSVRRRVRTRSLHPPLGGFRLGSHPISGHREYSPFPKGSLREDDPFFPLEAEMGFEPMNNGFASR